MTIAHHTSAETLAQFAAGTLSEGAALVVKTHLSYCPLCRERAARFEAVGGALLDELPPAELSPGVFDRTMAALDAAALNTAPVAPRPAQPGDIVLPPPLREYRVKNWRWLGPGVRWAAVDIRDENVFLIRVEPGKSLPQHTHTGTEYACVIAGAFTDETGRYGPGDMAEAGSELEHVPVVEKGQDCICLFALEGKMRFTGFFPRLLQPLFRL